MLYKIYEGITIIRVFEENSKWFDTFKECRERMEEPQ